MIMREKIPKQNQRNECQQWRGWVY